MKSASSAGAVAATVLVHAALLAAAWYGLEGKPRMEAPRPITIDLLPPRPPEPLPVQTPPAQVPPPPPAAQPEPRPKRPPKPAPARPATPPPAKPADTAPTPAPVPAPAPPVTAPPAPPSPAPAPNPAPAAPPPPPAPPARTGVNIPASYAASNRKPEYPAMSRRYDEQGTVVLRVFVREDGSAGEVQIRSSSGFPLLDESARGAVQSWRFNPATVDGKPVGEWYQLSIPFKLQN